MHIETFAQRLLNPFRGVTHTIKYASAEAITLDGIHWDIYVANEELLVGLEVSQWTQVSDIRYGKWSHAEGLKRGPIYPSDDFRRMEEMGAIVYEHLISNYQNAPFPFKDHYELWLLDSEASPLALLDSAVDERAITLALETKWRAGIAAQKTFTSQAMDKLTMASTSEISAAGYLTDYINNLAGKSATAQWFRRNIDDTGTGFPGIGLSSTLEGRVLSPDAFPALLLSNTKHDDTHRQLINEFHNWQAPCLLLLPHLAQSTRRALEQHARKQALMVYNKHRLYPQIIDKSEINAALVEALISRNQPIPEIKEDTLSPFYIELSPSPTE